MVSHDMKNHISRADVLLTALVPLAVRSTPFIRSSKPTRYKASETFVWGCDTVIVGLCQQCLENVSSPIERIYHHVKITLSYAIPS